MEDRIKTLEETNTRLLLELGYLQGKATENEALVARIAKLEAVCEEHRVRENRAWDRRDEAIRERDATRAAAAEAIRLLQVEIEKLKQLLLAVE